jgi:hypothetical protein
LREGLGQDPNLDLGPPPYIVFVSPQLINHVVRNCLTGCFTPATLRACIAEELRIPLEYREVYNFIRRLARRGLVMREDRCYKPTEKLYELLIVNDDKILRLLQWIRARRPPWRGSAFEYAFLRVLFRVHVRGSVRFIDYMAFLFIYGLLRVLGVRRRWREMLKRGGWSESELRRMESFVAWCVRNARLLDVDCDGHGRKGFGRGQPLDDAYGSEEHGCDSLLEVPDACEPLLRFVKIYFKVMGVVEDGGREE